MTLEEAKTADAIIAHRVNTYGDTREQLDLFGACATASELAKQLKVSVSTARKRAENAVAAGVVKKMRTSSRRARLKYGVQLAKI